LKRQRIDIYRPLMRSMKPVPRSKLSQSQRRSLLKPMREKIEPFFPGYAFIDFSEAGERWREIFKMAHIRGLVCANNLPVEVPWALILKIQGLEIDGAVPSATAMTEFTFLIGEKVRVTDGPFASFGGTVSAVPKWMTADATQPATLAHLDESDRVKLLVDIFGRQSLVELSLDQIEKV
jgi:transcriptional antiterminator NusG